MEVLQPEACSFCLTITSLSGGSGALWEDLRSPAPPPTPQHLLWAGCCLSLLILCLLLGNFQESPGSLRERLHQLQLEILACWSFFACSGEVCSFGNWFLVPCFLPCLSCCLQLHLLILCLLFPGGSSSQFFLCPPAFIMDHILSQV